ncbi:unnamed protein product [Arctogadus glacialis]
MAEEIYTMPYMARNTQGEREERIVEIYATSESLRDQHQDYVGTEESSITLGTVRSQQPDPVSPPQCQIRAVVVLLVLLSVALLAGLLGFAVQHKTIMEKTVSMDRDVEQLVQRLKNVTEQHKTVSMEGEKLVQRLKNVTEQHKTVSMEVEQLLQRLKNVTEQRDSLLCKQECPGGWDKFGCKCYQVTRVWGSWNKHRKRCVSKGADLVVVDSKEEMDFISRMDVTENGKASRRSQHTLTTPAAPMVTVVTVDSGDVGPNGRKREGLQMITAHPHSTDLVAATAAMLPW